MFRTPTRAVTARKAAPLLPVATVQKRVLDAAIPMPPETIALADAVGRVTSQDIRAREPFPPFPASTMDGYAVRAQDGEGVFPIQGHILAGHPVAYTQSPGHVSYITTGAPLPAGANAVVRVEDTEPVGDRVRIRVGVEANTNVRQSGSDLAMGQLLIAAGTRIGPVALGLLSTAGISRLEVHGRPRVAVLSTGDEVCHPDQVPAFGQIRDSNNPTLTQLLTRMGVEVHGGTHVAQDTRERLHHAFAAALRSSDLVLSTGGVSMGELDLLPALLQDMGAELHSERINMKPGKPFVFATLHQAARPKLIFALPGNPVSAVVTFYVFVALAVRRLQGMAECRWPHIGVMMAEPLQRDSVRPEFHRVSIAWDSGLHAGAGGYRGISTGSQASSRLLSLLDADALVEVAPGPRDVAPGTVLPALDLRQR